MPSSRVYLLLVLVATVIPANAQDMSSIDIETHIHITSMAVAEPPSVREYGVLFSYSSPQRARYVGVAFAHESYVQVHLFYRNANGVYVLLYRPPEGLDELVYRYVVDGLWQPDPYNPVHTRDDRGTLFSRLSIAGAFPIVLESPMVSPGGRVKLSYVGQSGSSVYVTGDFTNWDPFLYHLTETSPGTFTLDVTLPPGLHRYVFVVNGSSIIDPLNPRTAVRSDGRRVSVMAVP
jgi:hypothetical protein